MCKYLKINIDPNTATFHIQMPRFSFYLDLPCSLSWRLWEPSIQMSSVAWW